MFKNTLLFYLLKEDLIDAIFSSEVFVEATYMAKLKIYSKLNLYIDIRLYLLGKHVLQYVCSSD